MYGCPFPSAARSLTILPRSYFSQVEALLRRSLGVSAGAKARDIDAIKPAPAVEAGPLRPSDPSYDPKEAEEANVPSFENPDEWANWAGAFLLLP